MVLLYMVTFTINIPPMLAYIPYMDPMGYEPSMTAPLTDRSDRYMIATDSWVPKKKHLTSGGWPGSSRLFSDR